MGKDVFLEIFCQNDVLNIGLTKFLQYNTLALSEYNWQKVEKIVNLYTIIIQYIQGGPFSLKIVLKSMKYTL